MCHQYSLFETTFSICFLQGVVDSSTDIDLLWTEIKAARNVLTQIQNMRQGRLGDTAVTVESEVILQTVTLKYFCRQSQKSAVLVSRKI